MDIPLVEDRIGVTQQAFGTEKAINWFIIWVLIAYASLLYYIIAKGKGVTEFQDGGKGNCV